MKKTLKSILNWLTKAAIVVGIVSAALLIAFQSMPSAGKRITIAVLAIVAAIILAQLGVWLMGRRSKKTEFKHTKPSMRLSADKALAAEGKAIADRKAAIEKHKNLVTRKADLESAKAEAENAYIEARKRLESCSLDKVARNQLLAELVQADDALDEILERLEEVGEELTKAGADLDVANEQLNKARTCAKRAERLRRGA